MRWKSTQEIFHAKLSLKPDNNLERTKMKLTIDRISGTTILLFALFAVWETRVLPFGTHQHPGPGYLPLLLSSLLAILGILIIIRGYSAPPFNSIKWDEWRHVLAITISCVLAALFIETLGYLITMLLLLVFLFGVVERLKLSLVITLTLGLTVGSYFVFSTLLKVFLPRGIWGF